MIAGSVNFFMLLPAIFFLGFVKYEYNNGAEDAEKVLKFTVANLICWLINLSLFICLLTGSGRKEILRRVILYIISFLVTVSIGFFVTQTHFYTYFSDKPRHPTLMGALLYVTCINLLSLIAIELIIARNTTADFRLEYATMVAENASLRMKSLEAQHEKLRNQLHPHFLFNSLSALKTLIRTNPLFAESYLVKLSDFLRFSLSHNDQNLVPLKEELRFSLYYLEMLKIRFRDAMIYEVDIPGEIEEGAVLPVFSLQLVLENAIKHNQLTLENPLHIVIRYCEPGVLLVRNNIKEKVQAETASGIGLKNLSDRYLLLIQEDIVVENDGDYFTVQLKIIRP